MGGCCSKAESDPAQNSNEEIAQSYSKQGESHAGNLNLHYFHAISPYCI